MGAEVPNIKAIQRHCQARAIKEVADELGLPGNRANIEIGRVALQDLLAITEIVCPPDQTDHRQLMFAEVDHQQLQLSA